MAKISREKAIQTAIPTFETYTQFSLFQKLDSWDFPTRRCNWDFLLRAIIYKVQDFIQGNNNKKKQQMNTYV